LNFLVSIVIIDIIIPKNMASGVLRINEYKVVNRKIE